MAQWAHIGADWAAYGAQRAPWRHVPRPTPIWSSDDGHPKKASYFNRFLSSRYGSSSLERKTRAGLFRGSLRTCLVRGALRLSHQPIRQGRPLLQSLSSGDVCEEKLGICIFESLDAPGPRLCRRTFGSLARTCCWQCLALCFPVC